MGVSFSKSLQQITGASERIRGMIVAMRTMPRRALVACALALACAACSTPSGRGSVTYGSSPTASPASPSLTPSATSTDDSTGLGLNIVPGTATPFNDGAALVTVQSVDTARQGALVIVKCGRTVSANKVIPPGFYQVDLHNAMFQMTSNPADPATGHVSDITFDQWAQATATHRDWELFVRPQGTTVSDGPTYDVCTNANGG
jgi:hypothetical protein